ncbi:MAG: NeuD/PglB/VioB family sugar acetyltransferase [Rhodospirillaceae bacterium]
MAEPDIILVGAGGHARVLIDIMRRRGLNVAAAIDIDVRLHGHSVDGVPVIGSDEAIFIRDPADVRLVCGQGNVPGGGVSGLARRRAVFERFTARGYAFMSVVSRDAVISNTAVLDNAVQVFTGAIIHPGSVVGVNTIINTGAQVDHDCIIGSHSHIAPAAVLCGGVIIGAECHIGAGAVVIPQIKIGEGAVVGAGAVVVQDVPTATTVVGNPARKKP